MSTKTQESKKEMTKEVQEVLDSEHVLAQNPYCEHCAYLEEGSKLINKT